MMKPSKQSSSVGAVGEMIKKVTARPLHHKLQRSRQNGSSFMQTLAVLSVLLGQCHAWGNNNNGYSQADESVYGNTFVRDWMYDSKSLSFKVDGCVWGYVEDSEDVGCLEDESEDGTTNWYMMANCRRPQVAFSVYASSSSSTSCNANNFVGSVSTPPSVSKEISTTVARY